MARDAGMLTLETLPSYVRAAHGLDESWVPYAACRSDAGVVGLMWTVEPRGKRTIGGSIYPNVKLIELALQICSRCPVQWECATYAIESHSWINQRGRLTVEIYGTWSCRVDDLTWLARQEEWRGMIGEAAEEWEPVQVMVRRRRETC